jgi:hypothetical protein
MSFGELRQPLRKVGEVLWRKELRKIWRKQCADKDLLSARYGQVWLFEPDRDDVVMPIWSLAPDALTCLSRERRSFGFLQVVQVFNDGEAMDGEGDSLSIRTHGAVDSDQFPVDVQ